MTSRGKLILKLLKKQDDSNENPQWEPSLQDHNENGCYLEPVNNEQENNSFDEENNSIKNVEAELVNNDIAPDFDVSIRNGIPLWDHSHNQDYNKNCSHLELGSDNEQQMTSLEDLLSQPSCSYNMDATLNVVCSDFKAGRNNQNPDKKENEEIAVSSGRTYTALKTLLLDESEADDTDKDPDYTSESSSNLSTSDEEEMVTSKPKKKREPLKVREAAELDLGIDKEESHNGIENRDTQIDPPEKGKKVRKRKAKPENWKKNISKRLRNSGEAYTSTSKTNKVFEKKILRDPCGEKCRLKCNTKFTNDERQQILDEYWSLANIDKQRSFILTCMQTVTPRYSYKKDESHRKENNAFYFSKNGQKVRVCKHFFMSTLAINSRPIRTVIEKKSVITGASVSTDLRGKHGNHLKVPESVKNGIRSFIESIPRVESHYCRSNTTREFIEGGKTLAQIHRDYVDKCKHENIDYGNYLMFSRIFNEEFNISFFTPKKDRCELCVRYENTVGEDKEIIDAYEAHILEKDLTRLDKDKDKKSLEKNVVVAVYDLQAVMPVPRGEISTFYYISKINMLNFTVHELKSGDTHCFVWIEGQGKRGTNEISSCVLRYLESLKHKLKDCDNKPLDIILYSDNCGGQQKNRFIIAMYLYALSKLDFINSITHKYLITGHSQNEGDSIHSVIEKQIKLALKSGPIYVPDQYVTLIKTAKKNGPPYNVHELTHADFYDFKEFLTHLGQNFNVDEKECPIKFNGMKILRFEKENPQSFFYKTSYSDKEFQRVNLDQELHAKKTPRLDNKKRQSPRIQKENPPCNDKKPDIRELKLKKLYKGQLPIADNKKKDLMSLLKKQVIPPFYAQIYENLLN